MTTFLRLKLLALAHMVFSQRTMVAAGTWILMRVLHMDDAHAAYFATALATVLMGSFAVRPPGAPPWHRDSVQAGESLSPMLLDSHVLPFVTASASRTVGVAIMASKPITQGTISYSIEKDGVVTDTAVLGPGLPYKSLDVTQRTFSELARLRLLLSSSADLQPLGMDTIAWIIVP